MQDEEPSVTVTTDIAAPPETVWRVLTEFSRYAAWHPMLALDGTAPAELTPGALVPFRLTGGPVEDQSFTAEVVEVAAPGVLSWQAGDPDVFHGRHTFELRPLPGNGTRFIDTERWSGPMAATMIGGNSDTLRQSYARSAAALKQESEREQVTPAPPLDRG
jgi:uncharacterized protein YndB with AHSA1/START domain